MPRSPLRAAIMRLSRLSRYDVRRCAGREQLANHRIVALDRSQQQPPTKCLGAIEQCDDVGISAIECQLTRLDAGLAAVTAPRPTMRGRSP